MVRNMYQIVAALCFTGALLCVTPVAQAGLDSEATGKCGPKSNTVCENKGTCTASACSAGAFGGCACS